MGGTEDTPKISISMRLGIAQLHAGDLFYLFFGGAFLAIVLMTVGIELNGWPSWIPWLLGSSILVFSFKKTRTMLLAIPLGVAAFVVAYAAQRALAALAAGGVSGGWDRASTGWYFWAQIYLVIAILWLLTGVPHRARKINLDQDSKGDAQKTLVGLLAAAASIMSGIFIVMLHFGGGPLYNIDIRLLVSGAIFTIFLVLPAYSSVAKTCWQGWLYPKSFMARWGETITELSVAVYKYRKTGQLYYTIRGANGTWQSFFRLVKGNVSGGPAKFAGASCAGVGTELQLIGVGMDGQLYHTIRRADGTWQNFFELAEVSDGPQEFRAVSCGGTGDVFHVVGSSPGTRQSREMRL